jgi:GTPase
MTKEHLGLVIALKIPLFVVISKIDLTPEERKKRTISELKKLLKIPGVSKVPLMVKNIDDAIVAALNISRKSVVPIFELSAVEGTGIEELIQFLQLLTSNRRTNIQTNGEFRAYVDDIFHVPGVGTVVAAMVYSGSMKTNESIHLGPFDDGSFKEVRIKSIHYKRVPTDQVVEGQNATFALAKFKKEDVRKGMVLLSTKHGSSSIYEFEAEIYVLYHSTTIKKGYTPVIHCRSIRQSAQMTQIDQEIIRTGDRATVHFRFMYRPEHIRVGQRIVFREGRTKGIGIVSKVLPLKQSEVSKK